MKTHRRKHDSREKESRAKASKTQGKQADKVTARGSGLGTRQPSEETGNDRTDARIGTAVSTLLSKSLARDPKTGRFLHGQVKTGAESQGLFNDLAPLKAEIVAAVRNQLAITDNDASPTLLALIDGFAEAHLLRKATFIQLSSRGGPVTNKGRVRGLLAAWSSFLNAEMRAAERIGLQRRARRIASSPAEWLSQSTNTDAPIEEET